jgi:membrane-bound ClpP family serine protease
MQELYLGCLIGGILFAIITIIFGDILDSAFDGIFEIFSLDGFDFIHPSVLVAGITIFGGTGILLNKYSPWKGLSILLLTVIISLLLSFVFFFMYVKPMKKCENSVCFSSKDFIGKIGEVSIPISPNGCGEIMLKIGAGLTNQIAASYDGEEYVTGTKVIVAEVKEGALYVSRYKEDTLK